MCRKIEGGDLTDTTRLREPFATSALPRPTTVKRNVLWQIFCAQPEPYCLSPQDLATSESPWGRAGRRFAEYG